MSNGICSSFKVVKVPYTKVPKWQLEALMIASYLLTALYSSESYMLMVVIVDCLKLLKCPIEDNKALVTASYLLSVLTIRIFGSRTKW